MWTAGALIVGSVFFGVPFWLALLVLVVGLALYLRVGNVRREPVGVESPVSGRWVALNSPASRVPSHGVHAYGQTYAIDVVHEPEERPRPRFAWWPLVRGPQDFPAFGQPIHAVADGVVVRVREGQRIQAGEQLAACGNSGNSSEPHLHFHLMDRPSTLFAAGLPFRFDNYQANGHVASGVPANGEFFIS